jgi:hypothetical protein
VGSWYVSFFSLVTMLSLHVCSRNLDSPKRLVLWHRRVKSLQKCVAGILMYEMLYGRTPFRGRNRQKTFTNILEKDLTFPASIPVSVEIVCCHFYFETTHYPRTMQLKSAQLVKAQWGHWNLRLCPKSRSIFWELSTWSWEDVLSNSRCEFKTWDLRSSWQEEKECCLR